MAFDIEVQAVSLYKRFMRCSEISIQVVQTRGAPTMTSGTPTKRPPQESVQGKSLKMLQGSRTDVDALTTLKEEIENGQAASSLLINYKSDGSAFLNYLRVYPLSGDPTGNVTHFLGVLQVKQNLLLSPDFGFSNCAQDCRRCLCGQVIRAMFETIFKSHALMFPD